ncbi:hypothetical protein KI387_028745, partial [Taxus chinensis]
GSMAASALLLSLPAGSYAATNLAFTAGGLSSFVIPASRLPSIRWRSQTTRCVLANRVDSQNGRPLVPFLQNQGMTGLLNSRYPQEMIERDLQRDTRLSIFSGSANPSLAQEIACYLGRDLGKIKIKRFADGEVYVQLQESVRGCDVFLVQPTCPPANENLMELLVMIDACRRASAKNITAVIPYFGYARADRKTQGRESIAAKLVANLITEAGANRVLACDLHSGQSMGYFDIPVDHVYGQPVVLDYLASKMIASNDLVVVSPDVGGVARARAFAKKLSDAPLAIVDKRRHGHNVSELDMYTLSYDAAEGKATVMEYEMVSLPRVTVIIFLPLTIADLSHLGVSAPPRTATLILLVLGTIAHGEFSFAVWIKR